MSKKVVFVDDSQTVLMSVDMAVSNLVENGIIEVFTFKNPLDLIEKIKEGFVYDLLITDINMPQMNGFDLVKNMKTFDSVNKKPVLALTTEKSNEMKQMGKDSGINGWISKPFSPQKVEIGIKRVLKIR